MLHDVRKRCALMRSSSPGEEPEAEQGLYAWSGSLDASIEYNDQSRFLLQADSPSRPGQIVSFWLPSQRVVPCVFNTDEELEENHVRHDSLSQSAHDHTQSVGINGMRRKRTHVASKTAFATTTPGSRCSGGTKQSRRCCNDSATPWSCNKH